MIHSTALSFAKKVFRYSHPMFHTENQHKIFDILTKNNFPPNKIHTILHMANQHLNNNNQPSRPPKTNNFPYYALTYMPRISEALTKQLKYFIPDANVAHKPEYKASQFFSKQKDRIPKEHTTDCVYQINCTDCSAVYIGETTQRLEKRVKQHQQTVRSTAEAKTALARHAKTNNHNFDFANPSILERNNFKQKLQLCEVNHIIFNQETACNFKTDTSNIAPSYFNLLRQHVNKTHAPLITHQQIENPVPVQ